MSTTFAVLFVLMAANKPFVDFKTVKYESIEKCEKARVSMDDKEIYDRSFCGTLTINTLKESDPKPTFKHEQPKAEVVKGCGKIPLGKLCKEV